MIVFLHCHIGKVAERPQVKIPEIGNIFQV
jgi:hypothetical protein